MENSHKSTYPAILNECWDDPSQVSYISVLNLMRWENSLAERDDQILVIQMTDATSPENFRVREHERKEPLSSLTDVSKLPFESLCLNSTPVTLFWRSATPNSTLHVRQHPIPIKHNRPVSNEESPLARTIPGSLQLAKTKSTDSHSFPTTVLLHYTQTLRNLRALWSESCHV